jgi:RNA 2',3'-cyclic 3'-phosphodiesterase
MGENMKQVIRAFIAIELPSEIRRKLDEVEQQIQARAAKTARHAVRWVATDKIHLTLKFLGDMSADQIPAAVDLLTEAAAGHSGIELVIGGSGAFPNPHRPRVIWVGCEGGQGLIRLHKAVDQAMEHLGYPAETRPFSPHLTLGRVGENAGAEELAHLVSALGQTHVGELGRVQVERIHLFQSDLRPDGPIYTSLHQVRLEKG